MLATTTFGVGEVARVQAHCIESASQKIVRTEGFGGRLLRGASVVVGGMMAAVVDRYSRKIEHSAYTFRGLRSKLADRDAGEVIDLDGALDEVLRRAEENTITIRREAVQLARQIEASFGGRSGRVREALRRQAHYAAMLYDEIRAFRGAMAAHDADCVVGSDPNFVASTPDEVERMLERIFEEA